ncbi:hypothetical protein SAMN05444678_11294 [Sphingomonas sp. YR710]|uniref:hypothetical protein n=1 Tax=Sphingomonas sp. YR710 TaxID=1882773 RepID=UPI00087FDCED|nr:hypothetical protein [Sphingomonas sp. YR710]SDD36258.1 hypothetical protein SAMN05444678_11294 [Sphingomonas sp. YR710]
MTRRPSKPILAALAGGVVVIGAAALAPVFAQGAPESLLPPGFGQPAPANRPVPAAQSTAPAAGAPVSLLPPAAGPQMTLDPAIFAPEEPIAAPVAEAMELPESARRSIDMVGPFTGFGPQTFGDADGQMLSVLMRRLDVPLASRWASITLRRALLSRVATPARVRPADWIAERAWLLLRMGEADGARMLVQGVDVDHFNSKLFAVAGQTALATADAAGLCPLADPAALASKEPLWPLAKAVCAALSGDTAIAGVLIDQARRRTRDARGIDIQFAEKMMGVNGAGQRSVAVDWTGVNQLTSWRFGMASALGVTIPADLLTTAGPQVLAWQARAPMLPASERIEAAMTAARLGVFSNAALVDLYGAAGDESDDFAETSPAGKLRACYVGSGDPARVSAMRALWNGDSAKPDEPHDRYAAFVLTARAAARIAPSQDDAGDVAGLVGAMMSAGLDRRADRWASVVSAMSAEKGDPAWAILATGSERPRVDLSTARVAGYVDRANDSDPHKARMLIAALAGLGRLGGADAVKLAADNGITFDVRSNWARILMRAASRGQPGTVALLVAAGMQKGDWRSVSPGMFYTMIHALRAVGLDGEARMIAAEAMTRL